MTVADELYALVPADEVEEVVADLERHGIFPSEIEVHDAEPGRYHLLDERLHEDAAGARHGAGIGAVVGALAGLLVGAGIEEFGGVGWLGWFVVGFGGAGFGALVGGMVGLLRREPMDDDPDAWEPVEDPAALRIVAVRCLHFHNRAHHILERYPGVRMVDAPVPRS